jgi:hypothetical protein
VTARCIRRPAPPHASGLSPREPRDKPPQTTVARASLHRVSDDDEDFDLSAAGLRADGTDLRISVEVLAGKLEETLPDRTRVERRGGGLLGRGSKRVRAMRVALGACSYLLAVDGGRVEGFRERRSGGIAIKREPLAPEEWVAALTAELREEAQRSSEARTALERLVG